MGTVSSLIVVMACAAPTKTVSFVLTIVLRVLILKLVATLCARMMRTLVLVHLTAPPTHLVVMECVILKRTLVRALLTVLLALLDVAMASVMMMKMVATVPRTVLVTILLLAATDDVISTKTLVTVLKTALNPLVTWMDAATSGRLMSSAVTVMVPATWMVFVMILRCLAHAVTARAWLKLTFVLTLMPT